MAKDKIESVVSEQAFNELDRFAKQLKEAVVLAEKLERILKRLSVEKQ